MEKEYISSTLLFNEEYLMEKELKMKGIIIVDCKL